MISIDEFAQLMRISRSTAYTWVAAGRLEPGRHLLRIGRVVRIVWSEELLAHLLAQTEAEIKEVPKLVRKGKGGRNCCALDTDYLER